MPGSSRLARLLQASCLLQLALAAAWLVWRWPASPWQALAGALLVPLAAPLVLGVELLIVRRISRGDTETPVPSGRQLLQAWAAETVHWFHTFWWRQPFRWRAVRDHLDGFDGSRTPVVFVHGFMCNRGFWNPWMELLRRHGHAYVAVNLEPVFCSIDQYVAVIDAAVQRIRQATGLAPVLVCHSMGGLAARAWCRASGEARASRIVTIGSPHHGTWLARFSRRANGRQMQLCSAWLAALEASEHLRTLPAMTCWYSNCDNVVFPASTATMRGADNRFVAAQPHVGLAFHPAVMGGTLELISRPSEPCQGKSVTRIAAANG